MDLEISSEPALIKVRVDPHIPLKVASVQNLPLGLAILPVNIKEGSVQDQSCLVFGSGWVDFLVNSGM